MVEKKKWTYCVISVLLFTAIVLAVILTNRSGPVTNVHVGYDYPVAANLPEMAEAAQVVVIGKYDRFDSAWNMARDPNNTLREDPDNYTEGRLYAFTVDQVLKGEIADPNILVNHRYAETHTVKESDAKVNAEGVITGNASSEREVSYTIHDPLYIAPELGESYILFLRKDQTFGNYYGAIEPFSIKIEPDDTVTLQSNLIDRAGDFEETVPVKNGQTLQMSISAGMLEDTISQCPLGNILEQLSAITQKAE